MSNVEKSKGVEEKENLLVFGIVFKICVSIEFGLVICVEDRYVCESDIFEEMLIVGLVFVVC